MSLFKNPFSKNKKEALNKGLEKSKTSFFGKLSKAIAGKSKVDAGILDALEEVLIRADIGVPTTLKIIDRIEQRVAREKYQGLAKFRYLIREEIAALLAETPAAQSTDFTVPADKKPYVIMVVGVNGVGKTTTIGKLAYQFKARGQNVVLGAADTFRAGAIEQLQVWANRAQVPLIKQKRGSDPASVAFDTLNAAVAQKADVVIIDTAGRLHNKINLMNELSKMKRVMQKVLPHAPHEVLLVLDGSTGQNAFEQAKQFAKTTQITGLAITKIDGTAKGGVVIGISDQLQIPINYIGIGEGIEDLQIFNKEAYINGFFVF